MYAATVSTSHSLSQYLWAQHMIETAQRVVTFFLSIQTVDCSFWQAAFFARP